MEMKIEELKADMELRPYFFEFVCKGFLLGLTDKFAVPDVERIRFQREYYDLLHILSAKIEKRVRPDEVLPAIHIVSTHYLSYIGRIGFEQYKPQIK